MPGNSEVLRLLEQSGAILSGDHFVYVSGEHGSGWIDKDAVYVHPERTSRLGELLADATRGLEPDVVCGPATGGLIMAQWTAHHLGALAVFGEHPAGFHEGDARPFVLKRHYENVVPGKRVLVVDDVVNTGYSLRGAVEAVREAGGEVVGAGAVVKRGADPQVGAPLTFLLDYELESWPGDACPLCRDGVPVNTEYAHGRDFLTAAAGS